MDLNGRVDRMDEELKLLKNEIKQVLLEVQEHVLNIQNPFSGAGGGFAPQFRNPSQQAPASVPSAVIVDASTSGGGSDQQPMSSHGSASTSQSFPEREAASPDDPFVEAAGPKPDPSEAHIGQKTPSPSPTGPIPLHPSGSPPVINNLINMPEDKGNSDGGRAGPLSPREQAEAPERPDKEYRKKATTASKQDTDDSLDDDDMEDEYAENEDYETAASSNGRDSEAAAPSRGQRRRANDAAAPETRNEQRMDMVTLAGLAQWAERALNRVGSEHIKALLEVSEMTGRIPREMKEALILLLPLLEDRSSRVTAREIVSLMTQLGGFLGSGTMTDLRLLPFLLQEDAEVFPLTRQ